MRVQLSPGAQSAGANMTDKLIAGAATYRRKNGQTEWLFVKETEDGSWELPKEEVRRGESSVRAILRTLQDVGGIITRVLEEAGRATVSTTQDGKRLDQRMIFYLVRHRPGEGTKPSYAQVKWLPYSQARRSLGLEREKRILRQANQTLKVWRKTKREV